MIFNEEGDNCYVWSCNETKILKCSKSIVEYQLPRLVKDRTISRIKWSLK